MTTKKTLEKLRDEKFGTNTFAKKWKEDNEYARGFNEGATAQIDALKEHIKIISSPRLDYCGTCKKEHGFYCPIDDALENADQVKSWSRHERAGIYDQIARGIVMFILGVIIGVVIMGI
jgi:hypothetical protein